MILFTIIALIVILVIVFMIAVLSVSGAAFIVIFGDLFACILLIWLVVKIFRRKKK